MTNPQPPQKTSDDAKAAAFFTGVLTLAAGGAGFLVAGLVLGFDYLLNGDPSERSQVTEQRARNSRARYEDALAWLEADRNDRARARKARREWFAADPDTRGDAPSTGDTFGRLAARLWNSLIVGGGRFRRGWKAGRDEAQQRRTAGDPNWWKPTKPGTRKPDPAPIDPAQDNDTTTTPPPPAPSPTIPPQTTAADDVIDAEIVPEPQDPASRDVVLVGQDDPDAGPDPNVDEYARRLDDLDTEVAATRNGRPADPSPPRTVLR